jgi:vitamin K-dependent gamma-carboxylase-like protein
VSRYFAKLAERVRQSWSRYWFTPTAPFWLAACRILVGSQLFVHLRARDPRDPLSALGVIPGLPHELWEPVSFVRWLGLAPPTETTLTTVWTLTVIAAVAMTIGLGTRAASILAAAGGLYLLTLPQCFGKINHGYNVLAMMLLVLPFARAGAALSVDSVIRRARGEMPPKLSPDFNWPVKVIQFSFAFMLFFAGWSKVTTGGLSWVFSDNLRNTLEYQNFVVHEEVPTAGIVYPIVHNPWLWKAVAAGVVLGELSFIAIMFVRRWWQRLALLGVAAGFIVGLAVLMRLPNPTLLWLLPVFVDWNWAAEKGRSWVRRPTFSRDIARRVSRSPE